MSEGINTVNVLAIDEEKLKFRVTATFAAPNITVDQGEYKFLLPIPTALANSNEYNSCVIDCNGFQAYALGGIGDPCWSVDIPGAAQRKKIGCIELQLDIPSSQTVTTTSAVAATSGVGNSRVGGYRELLFLQVNSVGDGNGNVDSASGRCAVWTGESPAKPIMCGNPFGKTITIRNHDPLSDSDCWLVSFAAGAGSADVGHYVYSFDITMVPNR
tara:strand:+ start:3631 stop:4275 length:645 start_codon:yes stop_codon:yes gene_type:complete